MRCVLDTPLQGGVEVLPTLKTPNPIGNARVGTFPAR